MFNSSAISDLNLSTPMAAGANVVAKLSKVELDEKGQLIFSFQNETGVLKHTEFNNCDGKDVSDPDVAKKVKSSFEKTVHIVSAFVSKAELDKINAQTYKQWCEVAFKLMAQAKVEGTECRMHVVINNKNYVSLAPFPNFISTDLRKCSWTSDPSRHKYVRTEVQEADVETTINPFEAKPVTDSNTQVPF